MLQFCEAISNDHTVSLQRGVLLWYKAEGPTDLYPPNPRLKILTFDDDVYVFVMQLENICNFGLAKRGYCAGPRFGGQAVSLEFVHMEVPQVLLDVTHCRCSHASAQTYLLST